MQYKDIITGEEFTIWTVRKNPTKYELMQSAIRISAENWQTRNEEKPLNYPQLLHDVRIFEKYAKKYGLQRELREKGII